MVTQHSVLPYRLVRKLTMTEMKPLGLQAEETPHSVLPYRPRWRVVVGWNFAGAYQLQIFPVLRQGEILLQTDLSLDCSWRQDWLWSQEPEVGCPPRDQVTPSSWFALE